MAIIEVINEDFDLNGDKKLAYILDTHFRSSKYDSLGIPPGISNPTALSYIHNESGVIIEYTFNLRGRNRANVSVGIIEESGDPDSRESIATSISALLEE